MLKLYFLKIICFLFIHAFIKLLVTIAKKIIDHILKNVQKNTCVYFYKIIWLIKLNMKMIK